MMRKGRGDGGHRDVVAILELGRGVRMHPGKRAEQKMKCWLEVVKTIISHILLYLLTNLGATGGSVVAALMGT